MLPAPASYLRALRILHLSLCVGVFLFAAIAILQKKLGSVRPLFPEREPVLLTVAGIIAMTGIAASIVLFRRRLGDVRAMPVLERKLDAYRSAQIIRWALAQGPALLVIVLMLLTSSPAFVAFAAAALIYLIGSRPPASLEQACETMNISWEERSRWEQAA